MAKVQQGVREEHSPIDCRKWSRILAVEELCVPHFGHAIDDKDAPPRVI